VADLTSIEHGRRGRAGATLDVLCFVILTILVWGVSSLQRGLWQDDVQALGLAFQRSHQSIPALFKPDSSPLRRLTILPSVLANATPYPIETLQIMSAALWLAMGVLTGWLVGLLLPGRPLTRFIVICLTLTATSDYQTASVVPLAYNVAAASLLAAVGLALIWLDEGRRRGRRAALFGSAILLAISLWTMDVALPAVPFATALFAWVSGWRPTKRLIALLAVWAVVLIPVAILEWSFFHDPSAYPAIALLPMSARAFLHRTMGLWLENFKPWRWAFARPAWYPRPPAEIPMVWMAVGSLVAAVVFMARLAGKKEEGDANGRRQFGLVLLFAIMALAANAAYAGIHFSELHYRTHILSRAWASAAIGILAGWAAAQRSWVRLAGWGVATAFVFFGTWGGMERQDLYLSTWRQHQRELSSILNAAPALRPGSRLILRSGSTRARFLATEAEYLTGCWLDMLYDTPGLRSLRLSPDRGTGCKSTATGLDCWREGRADCFARGACRPTRSRYEELVVMDYDNASGTYHLVRSLSGDPLVQGHEAEALLYHPDNRIIQRPWTSRQRRLLLVR
jgi:hypothetical protein